MSTKPNPKPLIIVLLLIGGIGILASVSIALILLSPPVQSSLHDINREISHEILGIEGRLFEDTRSKQTYQVISVIDGDTIKIIYEGREESVRLIGIDAPETRHPSRPVQCFGRESSDKLKELLGGKAVYIEFDPSQGGRDRFGRLLVYVYRTEDNLFINEFMIKKGYVHEYTYNLPYKYQSEFKLAESYARMNELGLWGSC